MLHKLENIDAIYLWFLCANSIPMTSLSAAYRFIFLKHIEKENV